MQDEIVITDMSWHNIYLNVCVKGENLNHYKFFISDLKNEFYPLEIVDGKIVINIVNIPKTLLLKNGKWFFVAKGEEHYKLIEISTECGYKLEQLDKVYRYGKEKYAYVITFSIKDKFEILKGIDSLSEMIDNTRELGECENEIVCCIHTSYMMINRRNYKRNILVESNGIKQLCKKITFIFMKRWINICYHVLASIRKKDGKHILLMSETRVPIGGNLLALDNRLKERKMDQDYCISYSFSKTLQQSKLKTLFVWSKLLWLLPKQDIVFVDDYVPIFKTIHLKKDTKLVQLWHAGVGFKSVGYSRFGKSGSPHPTDSCHRRYDYAVVGGEGLIDVYEEVFGIRKENFKTYGLLRLDGYLDTDKIETYRKKFYNKYPELEKKKIILFAPTYRGKTQDEAFYPMEWVCQEDIVRLCGKEYVFCYKMHPFIRTCVEIEDSYKHLIYDFSSHQDINELFYVTDILITDFSSNIYEFSLHRKPIIFYAPDKDFYQLTRGVHKTLDEAPGMVCESFDEIIDVVKHKNFNMNLLDEFVKIYFDMRREKACDLLIDELILQH